MTRFRTGAVVLACAALASTAVAATAYGMSPPATHTVPAQVGTARITIQGFGYSGDLTVTPGERVIVTNRDSVAHTLTDKANHLFDTGTIAANGGTGSFAAPTRAGSYPFGCTFHPDMTGTLTVRATTAPKDATSLTTARSVTIVKGTAATLRTTLTDRHTRRALVHVKVTLLSRADAKHAFHAVRTVSTAAGGHAAVAVHHPVRRTQYEWRYSGDARHAATHSGIVTIGVRTR